MVFFRIYMISLLLIALNPGCFQSPKLPKRNKTTEIPDYTPSPFTPPADSGITPAQLAAWFECNNSLDSLSIAFTDSVTTGKVVPCDSTNLNFCKAQNRICIQHGLKSGYAEYCWIMDNLGNYKNKSMHDSMKCTYNNFQK
jgi:hypothetical protein